MRSAPVIVMTAWLAGACGAGASDSAGAGGGYYNYPGGGSYGAGGAGGAADLGLSGGGGASASVWLSTAPPEKAVTSTYGAPVATGNYVWIPNPTSGRVAYIDATTLQIRLVDAGDGPTYIAAIPDPSNQQDAAIVLNVRSSDASIFWASSAGILSASVPIPTGGNAWAVSEDGKYAIAWTDVTKVSAADQADPINAFSDMTLVDLAQAKANPALVKPVHLSAGYRPIAVSFDSASARAFAVTRDGIAIVSLGTSPAVTKNVAIWDNPLADGGTFSTTNVTLTPDGHYALVRSDSKASLAVFDLVAGKRTDVTLPGVASDVSLSADGATAVVVLRGTAQVALLAIPGGLAAGASPTILSVNAPIGQVALPLKSTIGFFYTNVAKSNLLISLDLAATAPVPNSILLRAPILGVFPSDDASFALVLHDSLAGISTEFISAVSVVPVAQGLPPKLIGLHAPIISAAMAHAGDHAVVATGGPSSSVYEFMVAAMPSLDVQTISLASLPLSAGIVEGAREAYVAQNYADGRITFVNLTTNQVRTLTGFELASQVVDGTK